MALPGGIINFFSDMLGACCLSGPLWFCQAYVAPPLTQLLPQDGCPDHCPPTPLLETGPILPASPASSKLSWKPSPKCRTGVPLPNSKCQQRLPVTYRTKSKPCKALTWLPPAFSAMPFATLYSALNPQAPEISSCPLDPSPIHVSVRDQAGSLG